MPERCAGGCHGKKSAPIRTERRTTAPAPMNERMPTTESSTVAPMTTEASPIIELRMWASWILAGGSMRAFV